MATIRCFAFSIIGFKLYKFMNEKKEKQKQEN